MRLFEMPTSNFDEEGRSRHVDVAELGGDEVLPGTCGGVRELVPILDIAATDGNPTRAFNEDA